MTTENRSGFFARLGLTEAPPPWGLSTALLTIIGAFLAVLAASAFVGVWLGDRPAAPLIAWTLAMLVTMAFVLQTRRADRAALRLQPPRMVLPLLIALGIALAMLLDLAGIAVTGALLPRPEILMLRGQPGNVVVALFGVVLMVLAQPAAEELVFRGVALPSLRAALGPYPGLIICAVLYGIFHMLVYPPAYADVSQPVALWYGLALPALDGLVFSAIRAGTGSTRAAIVVHAAFGLFAMLKLVLLPA